MNLMMKFGMAALALFATPLMAQDNMEAPTKGEAEAEMPTEEVETSRELDLEERVRQLEEQIADARSNGFLRGENAHFTDDDSDPRQGEGKPGWRFNATDRPGSFDVKIGGYMSMAYRGHFGSGASKSTTFDMHRIVPQFEFRIADMVTFATEIEFEGGGADVGFLSGNEILVEYAELTFDIMPEFKPKAGLILIPFGRYNLEHDDPLHNLFDRPFVARRITPSAFDQPGVGAEGDYTFGGFHFHYDFAFTQGFADGFTTNGGARDARESFRSDSNSNKAIWLRAAVTPDFYELAQIEDLSATLGMSLNEQTVGDADYGTSGFGLDWRLRYSPKDLLEGRAAFEFEGEYAKLGIDRQDADGVNDLSGWYVQAAFQFRPWDDQDWDGWLRDSGYVALTLRFEGNDLDDRQTGGAMRDDRDAFTIGVAFRPFFKTVIRSEWKMISTDGVAAGVEEANRFVFSVSTYF